jgi:hypothetical protein
MEVDLFANLIRERLIDVAVSIGARRASATVLRIVERTARPRLPVTASQPGAPYFLSNGMYCWYSFGTELR